MDAVADMNGRRAEPASLIMDQKNHLPKQGLDIAPRLANFDAIKQHMFSYILQYI
ncbi:hypothetical protein [Massilia pseudoviolaceinigra]|uniref:hypothetical protein n=1 Tax=Massilia pseudoviolaceinigra TaxID=3057165 RepID=UPI002796CC8D|nr:hypothetical protein [Massilia sp. CCM 9206]MDQ1923623.1 hypothetical protein [Massilia sp. CCM 9206]